MVASWMRSTLFPAPSSSALVVPLSGLQFPISKRKGCHQMATGGLMSQFSCCQQDIGMAASQGYNLLRSSSSCFLTTMPS